MRLIQSAHWALISVAALSACGGSNNDNDAPGGGGGSTYNATVTRTALGIPHIKADNFDGLGYGYGYAFAEDNLCVLQEDLVTIRGLRSKHFGREGTYQIIPNGVTAPNTNSDFFWKFMATDAAIAPTRANAAPEITQITEGFVAGYNRYIRELKSGQHPGRHAACRAADWLFEITPDDMYRRYYRLALIASSSALLNQIATAQPLIPVPSVAASSATSKRRLVRTEPSAAQKLAALKADPGPFRAFTEHLGKRFGSNAYAFGKDATQDGSNMLLGNPHFPWVGPERLYMSHLTVPGKMDIMGASLYGAPAVLIGFNDHVAWSHTVTTARHFTLYELTLNPANPFQYLYGTEFRDIEQVPITIEVKESDGSITQETRTLYRSHYGPMLVITAGAGGMQLPVLGWTPLKAYTLRDANAENDRLLNQFAKWDQAKSIDEFISLHKSVLGVPWVNTIATGPGGKAYYGDVSVVPNVSDAKVQTCQAIPIHTVVGQLVPGLPVLDGSRPACEWDTDADAPAPGIFGPANHPTLLRDDWVTNNNDSYWITNPAEPLTGFARIIGDTGTPRSYRTQQAITQVQRRLDGSDGLDATPGFTLPLLQEIALSAHVKTAEYGLQNVLNDICPGSSGDAATACAALAQWDGRADLNSIGAHVWREFLRALTAGADKGGNFWRIPFSAADPVNTPRDLNTTLPTVRQAFTTAVAAIKASGLAFDARLGELQQSCCALRGAQPRIPMFGGEFFEGAFTISSTLLSPEGGLTPQGYGTFYANSYIQAVTWNANGVHAEGFITYSQSTDPASAYFADFTREYSARRWKRFPFTPAQIEADKISQMQLFE